MKTIVIYPGSFNPFHVGHADIIKKILPIADKIYLAQGCNPDKPKPDPITFRDLEKFMNRPDRAHYLPKLTDIIEIIQYNGLLSQCIEDLKLSRKAGDRFVIARGLRNSRDFEEAKDFQYWMEDLDPSQTPIIHFISDRELVHISSSAIQGIEKSKEEADSKKYEKCELFYDDCNSDCSKCDGWKVKKGKK